MINLRKINSFILKIIALVLMTLDHVGIFLISYASQQAFENPMYMTGYVFRCIGRLAFPLFILMLIEGVRHSKNTKLYLLRIAIMTAIVMIAQIVIYYCFSSTIENSLSPFIDLLLSLIILLLLKRKDKFSFLAIIPIAYIIMATIVTSYECLNSITIIWLPFYVRPCYTLLGLLLTLGFYYAYEIADYKIKKFDTDLNTIKEAPYYRNLVSAYQCVVLIAINVIIYALSFANLNGIAFLDIYIAAIQNWSIFACIIILLYNGKKGYGKAWFKYGNYVYYPLHIILIYVIFYIIFM